jgi:hypothetical protein
MLSGLIYLIFVSSNLLALESITIREVGPTKRTMVVNVGSNDLVGEGDQAYFIAKSENLGLKGRKVAKGEAVKVFANHSYWYLKEVELPQRLEKGVDLLFAPMSAFMGGREKYEFKDKQLVYSKNEGLDAGGALSLYRDGTDKDLLKKRDEHRVAEKIDIFEEPWKEEADIELLGLSHLSRKEDIVDDDGNPVETKGIELWQQRPEQKIVSKKMRDQEYEERLEYYLSRAEDPLLSLEKLYQGQTKDASDGLVNVKPALRSTYEKVSREREVKEMARERALENIQKTGPGWSAELSDEALRKYLVRNGLDFERLRQTYNADNLLSHEVYANFVTDMIDQTTELDDRNRGIGFGFSIGYELPLKKIAFSLQHFSLQTEFRKERNNFAIDRENVFLKGSSFLIGFNWYPYYAPSTVERFLPFVGLGMRYGKGEISRINFYENYDFNLLVLPMVQVGTKYRFTLDDNNAIGIRLAVSLEKNRLNSTTENAFNQVPTLIEYTDLKLGIGISYYF